MKKYNSRSIWTKVRSINLKIGFFLSLSFVFLAFQWNVKPKVHESETYAPNDSIITEETPRTIQRKKVLPPPPKPKILENISTEPELIEWIPEDDIDYNELDENDIIEDVFRGLKTANHTSEQKSKIEKPVIEEEPFIMFPSKMPVFGNCDEILDEAKRKNCSDKSLMEFIYSELQYPAMASTNRIEGKAVAEFIINKEGQVEKVQILRGLEGGINEEILRVIELMPTWKPGRQNMRPVNVKLIIPIQFELR